LFCTLHYQLY
jgi:hypothetical protein